MSADERCGFSGCSGPADPHEWRGVDRCMFLPPRPSSDEGTGRPGGWVPGIGWVALLRSLDGADRAHRCPGGDSIRADGVWIGGDYPVIVTRWADGTTPTPTPSTPTPQAGGET